jgi:hypothetical protein
LSQKRQFFADIFGENILKIITSVPDCSGETFFSRLERLIPCLFADRLSAKEQAGWPDEFVKKSPKKSPNPCFVKINT